MKKEFCQIEGCKNLAKYTLFNQEKRLLHVCRLHEEEIGSENMRRAGGYIRQEKSGEIRDNVRVIKPGNG